MSVADLTTRRFLVLGMLLALVVLAGCSSGPARLPGEGYGALPPDLPDDPQPCTTYCKVWVPPVYRDVPRLRQVKPGCLEMSKEQIVHTRFGEVCTKPRELVECRTPDKRCEEAVVQVRPGGYKWKRDQNGCWKYCYENPCYQWCNKVVTDEGIEYCTERPPEYKTVAWTEPATVCRQDYVPGEYEVEYVKEVYRPGYWAWKPCRDCENCDCPAPCPTIPQRQRECGAMVAGVPTSN